MRYKWIAKSNDGAFEDESALFETKKECYNDMRNAVLEKMKWNTEYDNDFESEEDDYIHYHVTFSRNKITHDSYSGRYTYEIIEIDEMKTLELTKDACGLLANCIIAQMEQWNKVGDNVYASEMLADARKIEIGKLKTLLDYITTDL